VPCLRERQIRDALQAYIAGTLQQCNCPAILVGAVADHVHILCVLSKTLSLSKLVEEVKTGSSKWLKAQAVTLQGFYWQSGYGAFSVSGSHLASVRDYIASQEEHHRTLTFQEELRQLLQEHHIAFDERYVWD
jgi:REP element-mobilizing transposase RayT